MLEQNCRGSRRYSPLRKQAILVTIHIYENPSYRLIKSHSISALTASCRKECLSFGLLDCYRESLIVSVCGNPKWATIPSLHMRIVFNNRPLLRARDKECYDCWNSNA